MNNRPLSFMMNKWGTTILPLLGCATAYTLFAPAFSSRQPFYQLHHGPTTAPTADLRSSQQIDLVTSTSKTRGMMACMHEVNHRIV